MSSRMTRLLAALWVFGALLSLRPVSAELIGSAEEEIETLAPASAPVVTSPSVASAPSDPRTSASVRDQLRGLGLSVQEIDQRVNQLDSNELAVLSRDTNQMQVAGFALGGIEAGSAVVVMLVVGVIMSMWWWFGE